LRRDEFEIILVDDCSTKGDTIATVTAYTKAASNMKLLRHSENCGPNEARRSGVKAASGDYVLFVDGDDMLSRDAVENLRMKACETEADVIVAPGFTWAGRTKSYSPLPRWAKPLPSEYIERLKSVLAANHSYTLCGRLFRRTILTDDIFDFDISPRQLHEDMATFVRLVFRSGTAAHIHRPIYYYTINELGATYEFGIDNISAHFRVFNDWIENAERHGVYEDLSDAISEGVERLLNYLVVRCVSSESLSTHDKVRILYAISDKYRAFPIRPPEPSLRGTQLLQYLSAESTTLQPSELRELIKRSLPAVVQPQPSIETRLEHSLVPTEIARRLKDKVVLICRNDYHLRSAAAFARELELRGYSCVTLDDSAFASGGLRRLPRKENSIFRGMERIEVPKVPYDPDWLGTARLVITFNDFNDDFREALEYRHRLGLPSVSIVEGINDFLRVDFQELRHLPYRRCDYVFLSGNDDKEYFEDRHTYVVGLPVVESLATKVPTFPKEFLAVLNMNFTYGALEDAREQFVSKARKAFAACGYKWVITRHPMDKADFKGCPVSRLTQYELIDKCSVFVSRFATGILEALASGKPVIYFNPHGEKVEKFKSPLGAYQIATNEEELVHALQNVARDIESGVDFRERALPFLEWHAGYRPEGTPVTHRLADAVTDILERDCGQQPAVSDLFFDRLNEQESFQCQGSGSIVGDFEREHKAQLREEELIARYFGNSGSTIIDVGGASLDSLGIYLGKGWTVHAFEPDPGKRQTLLNTWTAPSKLMISQELVCDEPGLTASLPRHRERTGISGIFAFASRHKQTGELRTTTLRDYYQKSGLRHVDFLKVDNGGFGKAVLEGFPWESDRPEVILVRFRDARKCPVIYSAHELADTLIRHGYSVYVSEWLPMLRGASTHDWKRLIRYSFALELDKTWGNMIAFLQDPGEDKLRSLARQTTKFSARPGREKMSKTSPQSVSAPRKLVEYLGRNHPMIGTLGRVARWTLATLKKNLFGLGGLALLIILGLYVAGALIEPARWYLVGIASGLLLLCVALLALFLARFVLNRFASEQRRQVLDINKKVSHQVADVHKKVSELSKENIDTRNNLARMNVANFPLFQPFNRRLTNDDLKRFAEEWAPKLGLSLDARTVAYVAHRICLAEDTCVGRLSGNIETMVLRVLVARSVIESSLEVLEIGTLFGVGVAMIHENCLGLFNSMHFTVIDPLIGHIGRHDKSSLDPLTKAPATREIFIHNMHRMNIPESDYTIIERLSTEDEALEQASERRYNLLIIDADHSYFGVTHDFYNYRHLVKRGGYIVFDDYGNPSWQGLTDFVDKEVIGMPGLEFVGTDVYSAVFRVVAPQHSQKRRR
jgi:FkbM family methyltransferase